MTATIPVSLPSSQLAARVLDACVEPIGPRTAQNIEALVGAEHFGWGELLEVAIEHKTICLLAGTLTEVGLAELPPRRLTQFLGRTLRTNQHATSIYRAEAARISAALDVIRLPVAAIKGIAVESTLYGGQGARQFSDLDLLMLPEHLPELDRMLAGLGYRRGHHGTGRPVLSPNTWHRVTGDVIVPAVVVDVSSELGERRSGSVAALESLLARRTCQPIPGHPQAQLPVLDPGDQLRVARETASRSQRPGGPAGLGLRADIRRMEARNRPLPASGAPL